MIYDYQIFLGFCVSPSYNECLNRLSSTVRSLFIQNNAEYLQQIDFDGLTYLGKPLGPLVDMQSLELFEANIYSLLRCLVADHVYEKYPLILLPIPEVK